jgi:hypothetical protein
MSPELLGLGAAVVAAVATVLLWKVVKLVLKVVVVAAVCAVVGFGVRQWLRTGTALPPLPIHAPPR